MTRVLAVTAAHARILARRRTALLLLALLPLAFYGALYRHSPHAITIGGVASAFSAGGAAIFSMLSARAADQRLVLAGYSRAILVLGRLAVLELASLATSAITSAVMIASTGPSHPAEVPAGVILTGLVAVPLGLALGALLSSRAGGSPCPHRHCRDPGDLQPRHRDRQAPALPLRSAAARRLREHPGHLLAAAGPQRRLRRCPAGHRMDRVPTPSRGPRPAQHAIHRPGAMTGQSHPLAPGGPQV